MEKKTRITVAKTLQEEALIAFFDPRFLFKEDGSLKGPHELSPEQVNGLASSLSPGAYPKHQP